MLRKVAPFTISSILIALLVIAAYFIITNFRQDETWIALGIAAVSATFSAFGAFASLLQADKMRRQREQTNEPKIVVYFVKEDRSNFTLVLENVGVTTAYNVVVDGDVKDWSFNFPFGQVISLLAPGRPLLCQEYLPNEILGKLLRLKIKYENSDGEKINKDLNLDLSYLTRITLPAKDSFGTKQDSTSFTPGSLQDNIDRRIVDVVDKHLLEVAKRRR